VLGINGSPRRRGNTYKFVDMFLDSCIEEGAKTELISFVDYNIKYCTGCGSCFIKGECPIKDDIPKIHKKLFEADGIVFGAPSYECHVPAQTKTFFDRSAFIIHRPQLMGKFAIALSVEAAIGADITSEYIIGCLSAMGASPVGTLTTSAYGPHIFPEEEKVRKEIKALSQKFIDEIIEEKRTHKIIKSFKPSDEMKKIMAMVGKYLEADYEFWKQKGWFEEIEVKEEEQKGELKPHFETVSDLVQNMPYAFKPENAREISAVIQFIVDDENFKGYLVIRDCECKYYEGEARNPTTIITTQGDIWLGIVSGKINPVTAMIKRKYRVKGDRKILTEFGKLFRETK
jgi:putative sterol carrier protein/NAD(P)H-dependent FMN reductase